MGDEGQTRVRDGPSHSPHPSSPIPHPYFRMSSSAALATAGFRVLARTTAAEVLSVLDHMPVDLVILEVFEDGMDVLERVLARPSHPPILVASTQIRPAGCDGYLQKPFATRELLAEVGRLIGGLALGGRSAPSYRRPAGRPVDPQTG